MLTPHEGGGAPASQQGGGECAPHFFLVFLLIFSIFLAFLGEMHIFRIRLPSGSICGNKWSKKNPIKIWHQGYSKSEVRFYSRERIFVHFERIFFGVSERSPLKLLASPSQRWVWGYQNRVQLVLAEIFGRVFLT